MAFRISLLLCFSMLLIAVIYATTEDSRENDVKEVKLREKRGMRWHQRMYQLRSRGRHMRNDGDEDDEDDGDDDRHHGRRRGERRGHRHRMRGRNDSRRRGGCCNNRDRRRGMHRNRDNESTEGSETNPNDDNGSQYRGHRRMHHNRGHRRGDYDRRHGMHHRGDDDRAQDIDADNNDSSEMHNDRGRFSWMSHRGHHHDMHHGSRHHAESDGRFNHRHRGHWVHQDEGQGEFSWDGDVNTDAGLPLLSIHEQRKLNFLSTAQNHFTANLHRQIGLPVTDIVYSQYGIFQALTMMYIGSRSHTAFQMRRVLHLIGMGRHVHHPVRYQNILLNDPGNATVAIANTLLIRPGINITASFLDRMESSYQTRVTRMVLDHPDGPETPVNELVSSQTHFLIPAVIDPGVINQNTSMILDNAMYFKGKWKMSFPQPSTRSQMFNKTATEQVPVQMMQTDNNFKMSTLSGHAARVLELPYEGDRFSMLVILPDDIDGLATIEDGLTAEILATNLETSVPARVNVSLPKFRLNSTLSLKEKLQHMGMTKAFDPSFANFVSMTRSNNVHITDVIQRAVVDIDESGGELASAAVDTASGPSSPISEFRCDHPFLFIIRDNVSKVNLFIGKFSGGV